MYINKKSWMDNLRRWTDLLNKEGINSKKQVRDEMLEVLAIYENELKRNDDGKNFE